MKNHARIHWPPAKKTAYELIAIKWFDDRFYEILSYLYWNSWRFKGKILLLLAAHCESNASMLQTRTTEAKKPINIRKWGKLVTAHQIKAVEAQSHTQRPHFPVFHSIELPPQRKNRSLPHHWMKNSIFIKFPAAFRSKMKRKLDCASSWRLGDATPMPKCSDADCVPHVEVCQHHGENDENQVAAQQIEQQKSIYGNSEPAIRRTIQKQTH